MNLYDYSILLKYLNKNYGFFNKVLIFVHIYRCLHVAYSISYSKLTWSVKTEHV